MKLLEFTHENGSRINIVAEKITGFCDCKKIHNGAVNTFIATGADGSDGGENGWFVKESFNKVKNIIQKSLEGPEN